MESSLKKLPNALKLIAILEIVGGIMGVVIILLALRNLGIQSAAIYGLFGVGIGLYLYSVASGFLLFTNTPKGIYHSRINQWLQVFKFMMAGFGYDYVSGIGLFVGLDLTSSVQINLNMNVSAFHLNLATDDESAYLSGNVVAIFALYIIKRYSIKRKMEKNII